MSSGAKRWLASPLGRSVITAAAAIAAMAVAYVIGDAYIDRLPNHGGYHLVSVDDSVLTPPDATPHRLVVVVIDGLRRDKAVEMQATKRLAAAGRCMVGDAGALTVSRPVFAVISTGLEADRTGVRNNDDQSPVTAISVWQMAKAVGKRVSAISDLNFWKQMFPGNFDHYQKVHSNGDNLFAMAQLTDVTLIHPGFVDGTGHAKGGVSPEYSASVARVDGEFIGLLDKLDLSRDTVVFTADHGHVAAGGHGASQPEVRQVLTCVAGFAVRRANAPSGDLVTGTLDHRAIAPLMSVLLGAPFPSHMRASQPGDDVLDTIWPLLDESVLGARYVEHRKGAIERFRSVNQVYLREHSGESTWAALYRSERRGQLYGLAATLLIVFAAIGLSWRRQRRTLKGAALAATWIVGSLAISIAIYVLLRGSFDFSSINKRHIFLYNSVGACAIGAALAALVHIIAVRNPRAAAQGHVTVALSIVALSIAHLIVYGDPLGFPLPGRYELLFPFFAGALVIAHGMFAAGFSAVAAIGVSADRR